MKYAMLKQNLEIHFGKLLSIKNSEFLNWTSIWSDDSWDVRNQKLLAPPFFYP
jgi:hypothetical protein